MKPTDQAAPDAKQPQVLEELVEKFKAAWERDRSSPPVVKEFLPTDQAMLAQVLPQLLCADLEYRARAGLRVRVEDYLNQYKELVNDSNGLLELIVVEYRCRRFGQMPATPQEFFDRFPSFRDRLQARLGSNEARGAETIDLGVRTFDKSPIIQRLDLSKAPREVPALLDQLHELQLISGADLRELASILPSCANTEALLCELERRGLLTPYQVELIGKNKQKQLVFGSYVLIEPVGKGGMGQVFKARHRVMKRVVALKIIRKGHFPHGEAVRRFTLEIEAAAKLSHPNIVIAHDAGRAGDFHYFVMEFVEGTGLDVLLKKQNPLPIGLACELVRQTALGLQHAHDQGLVHRDIKPQNLILDTRGTVKILDMGLARVRYDPAGGGAKALTQMGTIMGTIDYIAPEQILDCSRVDGRADIYSLGCTFYQLLTGQPPYPGNDSRKKMDQHIRGEPRHAEELRADLSADLGAIIRKMLARKPHDRFATAAEAAEALARFSLPAPQVPAASAFAAPIAETIVANMPVAKLAPPEGATTPSVEPAHEGLNKRSMVGVVKDVFVAVGPARTGGFVLVAMFLLVAALWLRKWVNDGQGQRYEKQLSVLDGFKAEDIPQKLRTGLPEDVVGVLGDARVVTGGDGVITALAASPDRNWIAANTIKDVLYIADGKTLAERQQIRVPGGISGMAFSPDSRALAGGNPLCLWDAISGAKRWQSKQMVSKSAPAAIAFVAAGKRLITATPKEPLRLWDATDGALIKEFSDEGHGHVAVSADETIALSDGKDFRVCFWDVAEQKLLRKGADAHPGAISCAAFSADGRLAATGDISGHVAVWDVSTGVRKIWRGIGVPAGPVNAVSFSASGQVVAVAHNGIVHTWDTKLANAYGRIQTGVDRLKCAVLTDAGSRVLTGNFMTVRLFETVSGKELTQSPPDLSPVSGVAFAPDGKHLLAASRGDNNRTIAARARLWNLHERKEIYSIALPFLTDALTISADGSKAAALAGNTPLGVLAWDLPTGKKIFDGVGSWRTLKFTPDAGYLLAGQGGGKVKIFDAKGKDGGIIDTHKGSFVAGLDVAKDGTWGVSSTSNFITKWPASVSFWSLPRGELIKFHPFENGGFCQVRLSPDNRHLYGIDAEEGKLWVWEVSPAKDIKAKFAQDLGHKKGQQTYALALSPDGEIVVTGDSNGLFIQWSVPDGKKMKEWQLPPEGAVAFDIAPDNRHVAIGRSDGRVLILRLSRPK